MDDHRTKSDGATPATPGRGNGELPPAIVYAAKSTSDPRGSIPTQLEDGYNCAVGRFLAVADFRDENKSAFTGNRGPGLEAALKQAAQLSGEHGSCALIVQHSNRLCRGGGRGPDDARHLLELFFWARRHSIELVSVHDPETFSNPLMAAMAGEGNFQDSQSKSLAVKKGKRRAAQAGCRTGGIRPFGYEQVRDLSESRTLLVPIPSEFDAIRRMRAERVRDKTFKSIAEGLNLDGVPTVRGAKWSDNRVRQILQNRLYRGISRYRDEEFEGRHETPCTPEEWAEYDAVQAARRRQPGGGVGPRVKGSHLLVRGKLKCGACGASMAPRTLPNPRGGAYELYYCLGARSGTTRCVRSKGIRRERIDTAIVDFFRRTGVDLDETRRRFVERSGALADETSALLEQAERRLAGRESKLVSLRRLFTDSTAVSENEWRRYCEALEEHEAERDATAAQVEVLQARLAEIAVDRMVLNGDESFLDALMDVSFALGGLGKADDGVSALRVAIDGLFEEFVVHYVDELPEVPTADRQLREWKGGREVDGRWLVLATGTWDEVLSGRRKLPLLVIEPKPRPGAELGHAVVQLPDLVTERRAKIRLSER